MEIRMIIQISSGQGHAECELAVRKLLSSLQTEYSDIEILSVHKAKTSGCYIDSYFAEHDDILFSLVRNDCYQAIIDDFYNTHNALNKPVKRKIFHFILKKVKLLRLLVQMEQVKVLLLK